MRADWEAPLCQMDTGHLHYGVFLELLLKQTSDAFIDLEDEGILHPDITLGMKKNYPCKICKMQITHCENCQAKAKESLVYFQELNTHSQECLPVVTHTKQGICVVKGHGKNLLMDLIPVLPSPQDEKKEPLIKLYKMITTSLLSEKPPGWKKAFMTYFTKDKVVPEEMQELSQVKFEDAETSSAQRVSHSYGYGKYKCRAKGQGLSSRYPDNIRKIFKAKENGKDHLQGNVKRKKTQAKGKDKQKLRYILVKVLHYGPEPNYQVRATQSVNAIAQFSEVKADRLTFQEVKTLTKLLRVEDLASYLVKKVFLSPTNMDRLPSAEASKGRMDRQSFYRTLVSPEIEPFFSHRVKFHFDSFFQTGIIPLIPKGN